MLQNLSDNSWFDDTFPFADITKFLLKLGKLN